MNLDPYRIFFPLGWIYAVCGAALWVIFQAHGVFNLPYPGVLHASWMGGGFFLSFVAGFLMTAVPKFTGSHLRASVLEMALLFVLLSAPLLGLGIVPESWVFALHAASFAFLIVFFGRRYLARRHNLPDYFLLIPLGLGMGLLGALSLTQGFILQGRLLTYQAPMLCLMLGVGGKMIPAFLGWGPGGGAVPLRIQRPSAVWVVRAQVGLVVLSFVLEAIVQHFWQHSWPRSLRAIAVIWVALGTWYLHRRPPNRTPLTLVLRVSLVFTVLGVCLHAALPDWGVHGLHLLFIGGAGAMILGVGTRVTLAHGGHGLALEKSSRALRAVAVLIPIAAIARAVAPWGGNYERHLAYTATIWMVALVGWGIAVLPKVIRVKNE